jgi:lysophospholipase L1-like esterase
MRSFSRKGVARFLGAVLLILAMALGSALAFLFWQARERPDGSGEYVALGSSFAAGIGLGPRAPGSPLVCFRTTGGYPAQIAQRTGLKLVDMSCSGSTTTHILKGGQVFLGPQLAAIGPKTKLVTITSGGNDVGYVGDLMTASGQMGALGRLWSGDVQPADARPYDKVAENLEAIVQHIRRTAPKARIMIINYPAILPEKSNCTALGVDEHQAQISRAVAQKLALGTAQAAKQTGAELVDMAKASIGHDACSARPWVNGAVVEGGTAFHPNADGSRAVAERVIAAWRT